MACSYHAETRTDEKSYSATREKKKIVRQMPTGIMIMDSFHEYFDPFFELVIHLHADAQLRIKRAHERELKIFGERILADGDMYEEHEKFLKDIAGYDSGVGGCTLQQHEMWLQSLQCKVIRLDGAHALEKNVKNITDAYRSR